MQERIGIYDVLPGKIRFLVEKERLQEDLLQEIRLRTGQPLILIYRDREVFPMQDGKNTVQMTDLIRSFVQDEQSVVGQRARGAFLLLPAVMLQGVDASLIQEPLAFLGDRDHRDRITLCADLPQQAGC